MTGFRIQKKRLMKSEISRPAAKKERAPEIDAQEDEAVEPDEPIPLYMFENVIRDPFLHCLPVDPTSLRRSIDECRKNMNPKKEENRKRWLDLAEKVLKNERIRLALPPTAETCERLADKYPHLANAVRVVRDFLDISRLAEGPATLPPILLSGPPGAGKTAFALDLAITLGVPSRVVNSASLTHSFILGGTDAVWGSSKEGMILDLLLEGYGNPLMILDEIDKAGRSLSGSSNAPSIEDFLLNVLEPVTARRYTDEFLSSAHPVDASKVQWVFTANDLKGLSTPLLSRLTVISVREPTAEEFREVILPSLYRNILEEYGLSGKVPESLPEDAIGSLSGSPRESRKRILRLLAGYAREGKFEALEEKVPGTEKRIGFYAGGSK